eukprot:366573-Chlamydomonas_euryale.AAC.26
MHEAPVGRVSQVWRPSLLGCAHVVRELVYAMHGAQRAWDGISMRTSEQRAARCLIPSVLLC